MYKIRFLFPTLTIILGLLALVGWNLNIDVLKRGIASSVAMNPATAIGFMLLGFEGLCWNVKNNNVFLNKAGQIAIGIVIIGSAMKLSDLDLGSSFAIDQRLFSSQLDKELGYFNRMAPNTAVCFLLLACAMQCMRSGLRNAIITAQMLTMIPSLIALLGIVGYLYGAKFLYGIGTLIPMAFNTAIAFLCLSTTILFYRTDEGFMRYFTSGGPAGKIAAILLPATLFVPFLLGWISLIAQRAGLIDSADDHAISMIMDVAVFFTLSYISVKTLFFSDLHRQKALAKLSESAERFRSLVSHAPLCIHEITLDGKIASMNKAGMLMMGVEQESQINGLLYLDTVCDSDRERVGELLTKACTGEKNSFEFTSNDLDKRIFKCCLAPIHNKQGEIQKVMGITEDITEQKQQQQELLATHATLMESQARTQSLLDTALDAIISIDQNGVVIGWNPQAEHIFGYTREQALTHQIYELIVPPAQREAHQQGIKRFIETDTPRIIGKRVEVSSMRADGSEFPAELTITALKRQGEYFFSAYLRDITEHKRVLANQQLNEYRARSLLDLTLRSRSMSEKELLQAALEQAQHMTASQIAYAHFVNDDQETLALGTWSASTLQVCNAVFDNHYPISQAGIWADCFRQRKPVVHNDYQSLTEKKGLPDGHAVLIRHISVPVIDDSNQVRMIVGVGNKPELYDEGDLQELQIVATTVWTLIERKRAEEEIKQLAFYDPLTKLPNRRMLSDRLGQAMAASKRDGRYGVLMFLDLDNFKPINDKYGHDLGDLLLIEAVNRITDCVREMDTVARLGGDEFVIILTALAVDKTESTEYAAKIAERIRVRLSEPYRLKTQQNEKSEMIIEHYCTVSIGVVLFLDHDTTQADVLKWADAAMYQAKEAGKNSIHFFDSKH